MFTSSNGICQVRLNRYRDTKTYISITISGNGINQIGMRLTNLNDVDSILTGLQECKEYVNTLLQK